MTRLQQIKRSLEWPHPGPLREDVLMLVNFAEAFVRWDDEPDETQYRRWRELADVVAPLREQVAA